MRLRLMPKAWRAEGGSASGDAPLAYEVVGLPPDLAVEIAEVDQRWQLMVTRDGVAGDWQGDFDSADEALAALEAEVGQDR